MLWLATKSRALDLGIPKIAPLWSLQRSASQLRVLLEDISAQRSERRPLVYRIHALDEQIEAIIDQANYKEGERHKLNAGIAATEMMLTELTADIDVLQSRLKKLDRECART